MSALFKALRQVNFNKSINFIRSYTSFKDIKILSSDCQLTYNKKFKLQELEKRLTSLQIDVTQYQETERPWSGEYVNVKEKGTFECVVCNQGLFSSETKFESGSGWPSFYDSINKDHIHHIADYSHGMERIEAKCSNCGSHLGHLFNDGPKPTKLRYCINSAALNFRKND